MIDDLVTASHILALIAFFGTVSWLLWTTFHIEDIPEHEDPDSYEDRYGW